MQKAGLGEGVGKNNLCSYGILTGEIITKEKKNLGLHYLLSSKKVNCACLPLEEVPRKKTEVKF